MNRKALHTLGAGWLAAACAAGPVIAEPQPPQPGRGALEEQGGGTISGPAGPAGEVQAHPDADFVLHVPLDVRNVPSSWESVRVDCTIGKGLTPEGARPHAHWVYKPGTPLTLSGGAYQGTVDVTFRLRANEDPGQVDSYVCWWLLGWGAEPCARGESGCTEERAMDPEGFVPRVYGQIPR